MPPGSTMTSAGEDNARHAAASSRGVVAAGENELLRSQLAGSRNRTRARTNSHTRTRTRARTHAHGETDRQIDADR